MKKVILFLMYSLLMPLLAYAEANPFAEVEKEGSIEDCIRTFFVFIIILVILATFLFVGKMGWESYQIAKERGDRSGFVIWAIFVGVIFGVLAYIFDGRLVDTIISIIRISGHLVDIISACYRYVTR